METTAATAETRGRVITVGGKEMTAAEFIRTIPALVTAVASQGMSTQEIEAFDANCKQVAQAVQDDQDLDFHFMADSFEKAEVARVQATRRREEAIAEFFEQATTILGTVVAELAKGGKLGQK